MYNSARMLLSIAGVCLGLLLLIGGGTLFVRGASELAAAWGVSPMIVGLTIVGFGTSSPELVVNVLGALKGETAIAFGNVVGSNISNLGLVLGLAAVIAPIGIHSNIVRREVPLLLLATTMMMVMALDGYLECTTGVIGRSDSIILLLMFCVFLYITAIDLIRSRQSDQLLIEISKSPIVKENTKTAISGLLLIAGAALLFGGGEITVRNGSSLATHLGISATIIGLFVVAIGTSMPELVTSIIAALRNESDLALGNVVGSNIFNGLFVLPVSGLISPIAIPEGGVGDLAFSWLFAAALLPIFIMGKARLGRIVGALFVGAYIAYAIYRIAA